MTDRVKAQATLAQVQADFAHAARVSMLGELTASIAHEVNQPLGAILTTAETARCAGWAGRSPTSMSFGRCPSARSAMPSGPPTSLTAFARWRPRHEVRQECLALNLVVHDVLIFLGPELRRQSIATALELEPNLPDILADRVQLQQVIANIAINAVQAMDGRDERRLAIRTTPAEP